MRTDLALERHEDLSKMGIDQSGVRVKVDDSVDDLILTRVEITSPKGEKTMDKPMGTYITLELSDVDDYMNRISKTLSQEISHVIKCVPDENFTTLVVGLGNWNITPDALGPQVISKLLVTKHIFEEARELIQHHMSKVCAISPGVLGITGIETSNIIKGVVDNVKPDLIIAVDALASRKTERICSTIQLTDTGITPGSGVNNSRKALNEETIGIPVIAIGVPTVVDAATIANDTIDIVLDKIINQTVPGKEFYKILSEIDKHEKEIMIKDLLRPSVGELLVTPKDVDKDITELSKVIADSINMSLHPKMDIDEINSYIV